MHAAAASTALGLSLSSSPVSPTPMGAPLFAPYEGMACSSTVRTRNMHQIVQSCVDRPNSHRPFIAACRAGSCRGLHHLNYSRNGTQWVRVL